MQAALLTLVTTWAVAAPTVSQALTVSDANRLVIAGLILGNSKANSGPLSILIGPLANALITAGCNNGATNCPP